MKYRLYGEKNSKGLRRIQALRDIPRYKVKQGDLGGWVLNENNLDQTGDAWISGNAQVYGHARVFDGARVRGDDEIFGNEKISGNDQMRQRRRESNIMERMNISRTERKKASEQHHYHRTSVRGNKYRYQHRTAAQQQKQEAQPGDVSPALKRRMGDDISEMFEEAGKSLYKKVVESLKDVLRDHFNEAIPELDANLQREGGRRWQSAAAEFYRPWINDLVETIITQGMNEASGALEDVASSYAAEHSAPDNDEDENGDSLFEVPIEETEEVEEIDDVESTEEEGGGKEELELEELLSSNATFPSRRRRRSSSKKVYRRRRPRPPLRRR